MDACGPKQIEYTREFVGSIQQHVKCRAIDVGGGDGRFSLNYLLEEYETVDLVD